MAKEEAQKKKVKRPSAQKRDLQAGKARLRNRAYTSKVKTAIRSYDESLSKEGGNSQEKLQTVYSLMDTGVKKGVFKQNKASRTKSRLSTRKATKA